MYKALYRKWRPLTFDDVISQQHITETLKNQIRTGRTAHAYLFTGSRGTGKTTCARIFAKAVNCPDMKDGNPCLECDICRDADSGALTDIIEIDAASNNGVDDIRDIRDAAVYLPERCKYKIYIIDEVHMLSQSAFNALLKIMEEPPEYIKFILATTEIHKVPATITSRCQRYDFRRIRSADIAARLSYIASQEDIDLTEDGAALIAKIADGGMRDAVSLLDQCSACAEVIDAEAVYRTAGIAGRDHLFELLEAVSNADPAAALEVIARLHDMSKDLKRLCDELIMQLRNIMLLKTAPAAAESIITALPDELARLKALASSSDLPTVMARIDMLQSCRERMMKVLSDRVELEMCIIRMCRGGIAAAAGTGDEKNPAGNSGTGIDNSEIYDKIKQLEKKVTNLAFETAHEAPPPAAQKPAEPEVLTASTPAPEGAPVVDISRVTEADMTPCDRWEDIMEEFRKLNPAVAGSLEGSRAAVYKNVFFIFTPNRFFMSLFKSQKENAVALSRAIFNVMGSKYRLSARCTTTVEEQQSMAEKLISKARNSNIETAVDNIAPAN
ncbi:MAG: DNA polymerase III subunit gamma/tau [Ruminococcus sp.]|nr:DNA polymerase III subunit gamma/tau [Ruminococcus sp.]